MPIARPPSQTRMKLACCRSNGKSKETPKGKQTQHSMKLGMLSRTFQALATSTMSQKVSLVVSRAFPAPKRLRNSDRRQAHWSQVLRAGQAQIGELVSVSSLPMDQTDPNDKRKKISVLTEKLFYYDPILTNVNFRSYISFILCSFFLVHF